MIRKSSHLFALWAPELLRSATELTQGDTIQVREKVMLHRLQHVLRLNRDDECILFDAHHHVHVRMIQQGKGLVVFTVLFVTAHDHLKPHITLVLPLLKKTALEEAIYSAVEVGANAVQLIQTKKSRHGDFGERDLLRLQRIMIAAAEQSKHYALPKTLPPLPLEQLLPKVRADHLFFCNPTGVSLVTLVEQTVITPHAKLALMVGPEGDLTDEEKEVCKQNGWIFASLTPTVLRAQQAVVVGLGILRSALR